MKVFHGALVVMKGEKIATNLYMLKGETLQETEASIASCSSDYAMLWHQKLGHMSQQRMKVLVEQKLLLSLTKNQSSRNQNQRILKLQQLFNQITSKDVPIGTQILLQKAMLYIFS
ncbi:hypothetical protein V6N12_036516 [Hibiscus sabdariffa]|uniref:GAG-pre-integrase domain-containing protein n=1 Tax=Hibiscus sabdariffa TaxID=183260 RepID=A0ABR2EUV8_9ROSI